MRSIKNMVTSELIINKSKFLNYLVPVSSVEDANDTLLQLRKKYPDANHHCFAYVIGKNQEIQKYSDDGEPSKTAGMPMIEVLKKQELTNVLTVSIRYFGGIKLGAGGLVRAYTKSVSGAIKEVIFTNIINYTEMNISIPFDQIGNVEKHIRDHYLLLQTEYTIVVQYTVKLLTKDVDKCILHLSEKTKGVAETTILRTYETFE